VPYLARGVREHEVRVVAGEGRSGEERGSHRPKKGLLRGGKNRKEEGYARAEEKEAAGDSRGGERGWQEKTHGVCSIVGRCVLLSKPP